MHKTYFPAEKSVRSRKKLENAARRIYNALIKGVILMVTLSNGKLTVEISEKGAEMKRITLDGKERLWNGDPAYWTGTAPVLFPVCGGLPDDKFTYGGKEYTLKKHGFARHMMFEVEKVSGISAVFPS